MGLHHLRRVHFPGSRAMSSVSLQSFVAGVDSGICILRMKKGQVTFHNSGVGFVRPPESGKWCP